MLAAAITARKLAQAVESKRLAGRRSIRVTVQIILKRLDGADLKGLLAGKLGFLDANIRLCACATSEKATLNPSRLSPPNSSE